VLFPRRSNEEPPADPRRTSFRPALLDVSRLLVSNSSQHRRCNDTQLSCGPEASTMRLSSSGRKDISSRFVGSRPSPTPPPREGECCQALSRRDGYVGAGMITVERLTELEACRFRGPGEARALRSRSCVVAHRGTVWVGRSFGEGGVREDNVAALIRAPSRWPTRLGAGLRSGPLSLNASIGTRARADNEAACLNNDPALGRILNGANSNSRGIRMAYLPAGNLQCSHSHPGGVNWSPSRQRLAQPNRQRE